jgi:hypothetical protein
VLPFDHPLAYLAYGGVGLFLLFVILAGGKGMVWRVIQGAGLFLLLAVLTFLVARWADDLRYGLALLMIGCLAWGGWLSGAFAPFHRRGEWKSRARRR